MKTLFVILAVIGALFLAHRYIQTGSIGFGSELSEIEQEIRRLEDRLTDAERAYAIASRTAAVGGISTGAENALSGVQYVESEIKSLELKVGTPEERERLRALESRLKQVKRAMGIP